MKLFNEKYKEFLLKLLRIPTISPFEINAYDPNLTKIKEALDAIIEFAKPGGLVAEYYEIPPEACFEEIPFKGRKIQAPKIVTKLYQDIPEIRNAQPNLVLKAGTIQKVSKTICFNAHIDTVAGQPLPEFRNDMFYGRGAVDMKGPLAATLSGVGYAIRSNPDLLKDIAIRLQVVSGEESGPVGMIGAAVLVNEGLVGKLNIYCEPTNGSYFNASLTNMTALVTTQGNDAHDSRPEEGFVARHILGHIDRYLEKDVIPYALRQGVKVCLAGFQTEGENHSRVYGRGFSKTNIGYPSEQIGDNIKKFFEAEIIKAISDYEMAYKNHPLFGITAKYATQVTKFEWLKCGLPVLNNEDPDMERYVLDDIPKATDIGSTPFSCDAMWSPHYTIVLGPGDLGDNYSHNDREFIELEKLEDHAKTVSTIIEKFRVYVQDR